MLKAKKTAPTGTGGSDISGCTGMEGLLKKLNSHGVWKDRYGQLSNAFFMTYKPKNKKPTSEIKETIDLRQTESVIIEGDTLKVTMDDGEVMVFKGDSLQLWLFAIQSRMEWIAREADKHNSKSLTDMKRIHISGMLKKKSHNKYQGFQDRFVVCEGKFLKYYKRENDENELGSANLETAEFIRPFCDSLDCKVFEVKDGDDRVFTFETKTHKEMLNWVETMSKVKEVVQKKVQEVVQAKLTSELPRRIRLFDDLKNEEEFALHILEELCEIYPKAKPLVEEEQVEQRDSESSDGASDTEGGEEEQEEAPKAPAAEQDEDGAPLTIRQHLRCASRVVGYLRDLIPEVQKTAAHPARYDVLAVVMVTVNKLLSYRLLAFLNPARLKDDEDEEQEEEQQQQEGSTTAAAAVKRHPLLENANLGELHSVIDWIVKYQTTLKSILCPHHSTGGKPQKSPKYCQLFDELPAMCHLYAYGGSKGAKGGAAAHLYDHINKVWMSVIRQPEEMLQKHSNGTFYTNAPIGMWEAINQHISLAKSTNCPILHVMLADRVVTSLNHVINNIIDYVEALDACPRRELKEIELEFVSALANDTALHIEEVIELIENFALPEIRQKIDDIFDPMTTNLVNCGQACLRRLARLVMSDVQSQLDEVFMPDWLEGNQVSVAIATISDYMSDFEEFLVHFWADKFVYTILEEVILSYCRAIVFRKPTAAGAGASSGASASSVVPPSPTHHSSPGSPSKAGFFSYLTQKAKDMTHVVTTTAAAAGHAVAINTGGPTHVPIDEESLGRLAQDVNTLNAFFSKKAGQEVATEFLAIINEISLMLFLDVQSIAIHVMKVIEEYPSSALAVFETARALIKLRHDAIPKAQLEGIYLAQVRPCMQNAADHAAANERDGIAEGRLGLLYQDLVPKEVLKAAAKANNVSSNEGRTTLAQRLKNMSNIPLLSLTGKSRINKSHDEHDEDHEHNSDTEGSDSPSGSPHAAHGKGKGGRVREINNVGLLDDVIEVLNQQEVEEAAAIREIEEETLKEEQLRQEVGKLSYDGYLEKKSPAHNLWQRRFYKMTTRETGHTEKPFVYNLIWYKKEGGSPIKALEADKIATLTMVQCPRPLAYSPLTLKLCLQSEVNTQLGVIPVVPTEREDARSDPCIVNGAYTSFTVVQTDGKEHILRGTKVDRIIKWINTLSLACSFAYDEKLHTWNRVALIDMKVKQREIVDMMENKEKIRAAPVSVPSMDASNERTRTSSSDTSHTTRHNGSGNGAAAAAAAAAAAPVQPSPEKLAMAAQLQAAREEEQRHQQEAQRQREQAARDAAEQEEREREEYEQMQRELAALLEAKERREREQREQEEQRQREADEAAEAARKAKLRQEREELKARLAAEREEEARRAAEEEQRQAQLREQQEALAAKRAQEQREAEEHRQRMEEARRREEQEEKRAAQAAETAAAAPIPSEEPRSVSNESTESSEPKVRKISVTVIKANGSTSTTADAGGTASRPVSRRVDIEADRETEVVTPLDSRGAGASYGSRGSMEAADNGGGKAAAGASLKLDSVASNRDSPSPPPPPSNDSPTVSSMKGSNKNRSPRPAGSNRVSFSGNDERASFDKDRMVSVCFDIETESDTKDLIEKKNKGCPCVIL